MPEQSALRELKAGVVGLGSIGMRHLRNLITLGVGEVLGTDADPSRAEALSALPGATWVGSLERILDRKPDVVLVCSPTRHHADAAVPALLAGSHVFIEKPITSTVEDADRIVDAVASTGRTAMVGCNLRFHPGVAMLKRTLESGWIGRPLLARAESGQYLPYWRPGSDYRRSYSAKIADGGGVIVEAVHEFDYLTWFIGDVTGVAGYRARISDLEIDGEDVAMIALRFASGAIAEVHLDYLRYDKGRGCEILGTEGIVSWMSDGSPPEGVAVHLFEKASGIWTELYAVGAWDANRAYLDELSHFLDCVATGAPPILDAAGGKRVLETALRAREAATESWRNT